MLGAAVPGHVPPRNLDNFLNGGIWCVVVYILIRLCLKIELFIWPICYMLLHALEHVLCE